MAKKNVIRVNLKLTDIGLKMFKTIPTFKDSLWPNQIEKLTTGDNILSINHYIYGTLKRIVEYKPNDMSIEKID